MTLDDLTNCAHDCLQRAQVQMEPMTRGDLIAEAQVWATLANTQATVDAQRATLREEFMTALWDIRPVVLGADPASAQRTARVAIQQEIDGLIHRLKTGRSLLKYPPEGDQ